MKKIKKVLTIMLSIILLFFILLFAYAHIIENRSILSLVSERAFWMMNFKPTEAQKNDTFIETLLANAQIENNIALKAPKVSMPVAESSIDGMQVFIWNDKKEDDQKVLFYIHGGAYVFQPSNEHFSTVDKLSKELDAKVIFPIYPKTLLHNYKEAFSKMEKLYLDVLQQTASSENITLMGDSAGGGFSLGLAMKLRDDGINQPKDIILVSPWLDLNTDNPEIINYEHLDPMLSSWELSKFGEIWADGKENMNNPYVSPIFGDFNNLGKITIFTGTREIFYPDIMKLDNLLTDADIEHNTIIGDKMFHTYAIMPFAEGIDAQKKIVNIISSDSKYNDK